MEEVAVLIARSQAGDKEAREVLIEKNLGLVHHIVRRFLGRGYDAEEPISVDSYFPIYFISLRIQDTCGCGSLPHDANLANFRLIIWENK